MYIFGFIVKLVQIHALVYCVVLSEPADPNVSDFKSHLMHTDVNTGCMIKLSMDLDLDDNCCLHADITPIGAWAIYYIVTIYAAARKWLLLAIKNYWNCHLMVFS